MIFEDSFQFQVLMTLDSVPISTGGLYNHVSLLDKQPRFKFYQNWLVLVYTIPGKKDISFGALICEYIQSCSKQRGVKEMFLFTDTAERLYTRLGWNVPGKTFARQRNIVVMKKNFIKMQDCQ